MRKSYAQFCGLARSLDHIGDRWTLLIVRELLIEGSVAFGDLGQNLPGIAPNLLVERLRQLEHDGLIERNPAPKRSKSVRYSITPLGRSLEPALLALIRWGAVWMYAGPGDDHVDPRWGYLALRALLNDTTRRSSNFVIEVTLGEERLAVSVGRRGRLVTRGSPDKARAKVSGGLPQLLAVASGIAPLARSGLRVAGDRSAVRAALAPSVNEEH